MTLKWASYIDKRIAIDRQFLLCNMPDSLQKAIVKASEQQYEELYESGTDETAFLEDVLVEILDLFRSSHSTLGQIRYVWMALIIAIVVKPTVQYYQPNNTVPEETINQLIDWLLRTFAELFNPRKSLSKDSDREVRAISIKINHLVTEKDISNFQILSEALDVYVSAMKTLDEKHSLPALLDILDDCLEGYAIFPGSHGRRELFNWWLLDIVPSSWYLLTPSSIYSLQQLEEEETVLYLKRLEEISSIIWSLILTVIQNEQAKNSLGFLNTFDSLNEKVDGKVKGSRLALRKGENSYDSI